LLPPQVGGGVADGPAARFAADQASVLDHLTAAHLLEVDVLESYSLRHAHLGCNGRTNVRGLAAIRSSGNAVVLPPAGAERTSRAARDTRPEAADRIAPPKPA
jgi:hypothetical protein